MGTVQNRPSRQASRSLSLVLIKRLAHARGVGRLPSQSPNGASSPEGGAKSRLPLWGRCHAKGMTERAFPAAPAAHVRQWFDVHERQRAAMGANCPVRPRTAKSSVAIHRNICYSRSAWDTMRESAKKRYKVGCLRGLQGEQLASCSLAAGLLSEGLNPLFT